MTPRGATICGGLILAIWLLACLAWLPCYLATEAAGWRRLFGAPHAGLFPTYGVGLPEFLDDIRASTPAASSITLVGDGPAAPGEIPGTYSHLYPRHLRWALAKDGFEAAAKDAQFVALTSRRPLRAAGEDVLWVRTYRAAAANPAFSGCLMRGSLPPAVSVRPERAVAAAQDAPLRTAAGFAGFVLLAALAGAALVRLCLPGRLNALESVGAALLTGLLVLPAFTVTLMLAGLGLRLAFGLLLVVVAAAYVVWRLRTPQPPVVPRPPPVPAWLWAVAGLGALHALLCCLIPAYHWDTWMIWLLKAHVLWLDDGVYGPFWNWQAQLWECHPAYPLAWPAAGAIAGVFTGTSDPYVLSWTYQAVILGGVLFAGGAALRFGGRWLALAVLVGATVFPQLWNAKDVGLADVPLMMAEFAATALLAAAWRTGDARLRWAALVLACTAAAIKLEGVVFLGAWLIVVPGAAWLQRRHAPAAPPDVASRPRFRLAQLAWLLPFLLLAWYAVPAIRQFPDDRWRNSDLRSTVANVGRLPEFARSFAGELLNLRLPDTLGAAPLPPGRFWHPDEFLFRGSSFRFLHLPLLGLGLLGWLCLRRAPWREWLLPFLLFALLLTLYPLLYLPMPKDLAPSIQRLCMHLTAVLAAAIIGAWPRRQEPPTPDPR